MTSTSARLAGLAAAAALLAAGCSDGSTPAATSTSPTPAPPAVTTSAPPAELTVAAAAQLYVEAAEVPNEANGKLRVEYDRLKDNVPTPAFRQAVERVATSLRDFSAFLASTKWPAAVAPSAAAVRLCNADQVVAARTLAMADSAADVVSGLNAYIDAANACSGKVEILRQDLGLPPAPSA